MILFDVTLEALPDMGDAFCALLRRTMEGSQPEAGCLVYRFTRDLDDPLRFHLVELWEDEASLFAHARGQPFQAFLAELPRLGKVVKSVPRQGALEPYVFVRPQS